MDPGTVPLHAGHPGFLLEITGGIVAGVVVALALFVLIRRVARGSGLRRAGDPGRTR